MLHEQVVFSIFYRHCINQLRPRSSRFSLIVWFEVGAVVREITHPTSTRQRHDDRAAGGGDDGVFVLHGGGAGGGVKRPIVACAGVGPAATA